MYLLLKLQEFSSQSTCSYSGLVTYEKTSSIPFQVTGNSSYKDILASQACGIVVFVEMQNSLSWHCFLHSEFLLQLQTDSSKHIMKVMKYDVKVDHT